MLPDMDAYKAQYYAYLMNGLMTQLTRIQLGNDIEEAHMRNRALIAGWVYEHADGAIELVKKEGKTFLKVNDYKRLRSLFAELLAEIQRIKSEGDFEAARLHSEILERYKKLDLAPYKGFLYPRMSPVYDANGQIVDVKVDYDETYVEQMMRYSKEYSVL